MTAAATSDRVAVRAACSEAGLDDSPLSVLREHATGVYLLTSLNVVVRADRGENRARARLALELARWLARRGYPVTVPIEVEQPIEVDGLTVTFWRYYPQRRPQPSAAELGALLRELHALPTPPLSLPEYRPLTRLDGVLSDAGWLPEDDRAWLTRQRAALLAEYDELCSTLGHGLIHGDAYPGNTLWDGDRVILGDWDEVAHGPRELDLINTHQGARFGRGLAERSAFSDAYGWDATRWSGYPTLRAMRDLHTLAVYIERGQTDPRAAAELRHRIRTLRDRDLTARWRAA